MVFKDAQHLSETRLHFMSEHFTEQVKWGSQTTAFKEKSSLEMQLRSSVKDNATRRNDGHQKEGTREAKRRACQASRTFLFHLDNEDLSLWDTVHVLLCCWALVDSNVPCAQL